MMSFINLKFGNINNNKAKKIYNKGDIILIRPPNIRYPYKILSIKEKKIDLEQSIKIIKINSQQKLFNINDICSISNYNYAKPYRINNNNQSNNSTSKDNFNNSRYNNSNWLKKNNSEIVIKKKIIDMAKQKQLNKKEYDLNNIINKIVQRNADDNIFLKNKSLSYNNSKLMDKYIKNNNNKDLKINTYSIKDENSKFSYYNSTLLNNEKNKKCYKLKYDQFTSQMTLGNTNEKNILFKKNFENEKTNNMKQIKRRNKQGKKSLKCHKSNKEIKIKRQKSSKTEGEKLLEKITYKIKRPFSTDNRKRYQRINLDLKSANRKYKLEENKNFNEKDNKMKKCKKKLKIQKDMKINNNNKLNNNNNNNNIYFNYIKDINNGGIQNFDKLNKFIRLKSRKNSDIFDYILLPPKSEEFDVNKEREFNKDFTEYKSMFIK